MLTLFFVDDLPQAKDAVYEFGGDEAAHAIRVLRMQAGEEFLLGDGAGTWSRVRAAAIAKKSITVQVIESGYEEPIEERFTVIQAIPKSEGIKESIELMTEGGVDRIAFWSASRSIGKIEKGLEKLESTAFEASKQSRRFRIPEISGPLTTDEVLKEIEKYDCVLVFHEAATKILSEIRIGGSKNVLIIIGPEGGISAAELDAFTRAGARALKMGRPVLRASHAGLAALVAVNTALKVW